MIPLIAGAGVSLISSVVGGVTASSKAKEASELLDSEQKSLDSWYAQEISTDYLDTDAAKSTLSYLNKKNKKSEEAMQNSLVKSGATAEERVATAAALNENYADVVSQMAATDTSRRDKLNSTYLSESKNISNKKYNALASEASAASMLGAVGASIANTAAKLG